VEISDSVSDQVSADDVVTVISAGINDQIATVSSEIDTVEHVAKWQHSDFHHQSNGRIENRSLSLL
jgi:hypothetical protein